MKIYRSHIKKYEAIIKGLVFKILKKLEIEGECILVYFVIIRSSKDLGQCRRDSGGGGGVNLV